MSFFMGKGVFIFYLFPLLRGLDTLGRFLPFCTRETTCVTSSLPAYIPNPLRKKNIHACTETGKEFATIGRILFLAHKIRKSWILPWDRNSYPTQVFLPRVKYKSSIPMERHNCLKVSMYIIIGTQDTIWGIDYMIIR